MTRTPVRAGQPLPFCTPAWWRYLDLLEQHGSDFTGDQLATVAAEQHHQADLQARCDADLQRLRGR